MQQSNTKAEIATMPADIALFHSAILSSVKAALTEYPVSVMGDNLTEERAKTFCSFLSGYLEGAAPDLAETIFSIFKKDDL